MDDLREIGRLLGVPMVQSLDRGDLVTFRLHNPTTGFRLKLELKPSKGWLRLHADLDRKHGARHIATVEVDCVERTEVDFERSEVRFTSEMAVLTIRSSGVYSIIVS